MVPGPRPGERCPNEGRGGGTGPAAARVGSLSPTAAHAAGPAGPGAPVAQRLHHTDPRGGSVASQRSFGAGRAGGRNAHDLSRPRCDAHRLTGRRHRSLTPQPPGLAVTGPRPGGPASPVGRASTPGAGASAAGSPTVGAHAVQRLAAPASASGPRRAPRRRHGPPPRARRRPRPPVPRRHSFRAPPRPAPLPGGGSSRRGPYAPRSGGRPGRPASCRRSSRPGRFRRFRTRLPYSGRSTARPARWWSGAARSAGLTRPPVGRGPAAGHGSFRVRRTVLHPAARSLGTRTSGGGCAAAHRSPPWFRRPSARHARTAARPGCPRRTAPHRRARGVRWRAVAPALRTHRGAPARATGTPGPAPTSGTTTVAPGAVQRSTAPIPPPHAPVGGGLPVAAAGPAGRSDSPVVQRLTAPDRPAPSPAVGHLTPVVRYTPAGPSTRLAATARHHHDGTSPLRPATSPNGPLGGSSSPAAGGSAGPVAPARPTNSGNPPGRSAPNGGTPHRCSPPSRPSPSRCNGPRWLRRRRPPRSPARLP